MGANASLPYQIDEQSVSVPPWKLHNAIRKEDGLEVSVFSLDPKLTDRAKVEAARNAIKNLRTILYPKSLLKFIDSSDVPGELLSVVTERVTPLHEVISRGDLSNPQEIALGLYQLAFIDSSDVPGELLSVVTERVTPLHEVISRGDLSNPQEIALGLYQLASGVSFINTLGKSHTNISARSIFVTKAGDWKLGGFELLHDVKQGAPAVVRDNVDLLASQYHSMELARSKTPGTWEDVIAKSPVWAIDSWCVACVIWECFNGFLSNPKRELTKTDKIPKSLQTEYRRLLANAPSSRLEPKKLLHSTFLHAPLVQTIDFLDNIALKTEEEKDRFFKSLPKRIPSFPKACSSYKILPVLTHALEHGSESSAPILTSVLRIGKNLEGPEYERLVIPSVVRLFSSNERLTRLNMLAHVQEYLPHLDEKTVCEKVFPNVLTGITDTNRRLREMTIRSMYHFAPKLSPALMNGKLIPALHKLQSIQDPGIRADVIIVFGKIAPHISADKRPGVLFQAFSRGLKDTFPPTRTSALMAFCSTAKHFSPEQCARQLIPAVAPFCVDIEKKVRDTSLRCLSEIMPRLIKHSEAMGEAPPPPGAQVSNGVSSATNAPVSNPKSMSGGPKAPASTTQKALSLANTAAGWAASSIKSAYDSSARSTPKADYHGVDLSQVGKNGSQSSSSNYGNQNNRAMANKSRINGNTSHSSRASPARSSAGGSRSSSRASSMRRNETKAKDEYGDNDFFDNFLDDDDDDGGGSGSSLSALCSWGEENHTETLKNVLIQVHAQRGKSSRQTKAKPKPKLGARSSAAAKKKRQPVAMPAPDDDDAFGDLDDLDPWDDDDVDATPSMSSSMSSSSKNKSSLAAKKSKAAKKSTSQDFEEDFFSDLMGGDDGGGGDDDFDLLSRKPSRGKPAPRSKPAAKARPKPAAKAKPKPVPSGANLLDDDFDLFDDDGFG